MKLRNRAQWWSVVGMMVAMVFALHAPLSAAAQGTAESSFEFSELEGFQQGVSRTYLGDISALTTALTASPEAGSSPDLSGIGLLSLVGLVAQFDNGDNAEGGFDKVVTMLTSQAEEGDDSVKLEDAKIDDIGDKSVGYTATISQDGLSLAITMIVVQKDNLIVAGIGAGIDTTSTDMVKAFVEKILDGKAEDGEGTFNADGTSTGGLWNVFPASDDDILKGLTVSSDEALKSS
jgi:hypothetical protein